MMYGEPQWGQVLYCKLVYDIENPHFVQWSAVIISCVVSVDPRLN